MNLQRRHSASVQATPELVGCFVQAEPPTLRRTITGRVVEVDGYAVSVEVAPDLVVVVDIEDCGQISTEPPVPSGR